MACCTKKAFLEEKLNSEITFSFRNVVSVWSQLQLLRIYDFTADHILCRIFLSFFFCVLIYWL